MQNFPQQGFYLYYCMNCIIMWWQMSLQVWRMLQKPLCGNQMNLATLTGNTSQVVIIWETWVFVTYWVAGMQRCSEITL